MEWNEIGSAMVVFAHPDDAEFGSAGTVARLTKAGKDVFYVVVTDGSKGSSDPNVSVEKLIAERKGEQRDAARILGVKDISFLDFPDAMVQPTLELRRAIVREMRRYQPDVVICPSPSRDLSAIVFAQHPDHIATGEATLAAVYPAARDRLTFPELLSEGFEPHAVKEVWIVGTGHPDHFVEISETIDTKVKALQAHFSQVGGREVADFIPERAKQLAEPRGLKYAEAFKRVEMP